MDFSLHDDILTSGGIDRYLFHGRIFLIVSAVINFHVKHMQAFINLVMLSSVELKEVLTLQMYPQFPRAEPLCFWSSEDVEAHRMYLVLYGPLESLTV